jgi:ABC-type ATPase involved in cell division
VIRMSNLSKRYGRTAALVNVTGTIDQGVVTVLAGPTGSGKTTLLNILHGSLIPDRGIAQVGGVDVAALGPRHLARYRRTCAFIPQHSRLLDDRTVAGNLTFSLRAQGWGWRAARRRTAEMLDLVGMEEFGWRRPHQLSGGERQRVALARALASMPSVLLADEPTANLDPETALAALDLLDHLAAQGCTVVMASHDPLVLASGRPVLRLSRGRVALPNSVSGEASVDPESDVDEHDDRTVDDPDDYEVAPDSPGQVGDDRYALAGAVAHRVQAVR